MRGVLARSGFTMNLFLVPLPTAKFVPTEQPSLKDQGQVRSAVFQNFHTSFMDLPQNIRDKHYHESWLQNSVKVEISDKTETIRVCYAYNYDPSFLSGRNNVSNSAYESDGFYEVALHFRKASSY